MNLNLRLVIFFHCIYLNLINQSIYISYVLFNLIIYFFKVITVEMSITGKDLADKVQKLMPEEKLKITPEILNETCQHPSVQPFLKWFIENVGPENILSNEENRMLVYHNLHKNSKKKNIIHFINWVKLIFSEEKIFKKVEHG